MKGKPTSSNEQVIIYNVFKYFKADTTLDSQRSLLKHTAEPMGSSLLTVRTIFLLYNSSKTPGKKRRNKKKSSINWTKNAKIEF